MTLFGFRTREIEEAFLDLVHSTDGSEPCYDPAMFDKPRNRAIEYKTDQWVENWSGVPTVKKEVAEAMCAPCHVRDKCAAYALLAGKDEPFGILGGLRPIDRGVPARFKG